VISLFLATLVYVALKAFQQKNVAGNHYLPVVPVSYGMAACEAFTIYTVAQDFSIANILAVGTGASIGCLIAMYWHERLFATRH
jgi:hypothetical protein